jgi:xanthine dehydrogenase YagR molybdenum-binding subunit
MPENYPQTVYVVGQDNSAAYMAKETPLKISSKWHFGADVLLGQKLFGALLQCPYAHAQITSIDTSVAAKMPGVKGVITYADIPEPAMPHDGEVFMWGMAIAGAIATDPWLAQAAANAIVVKYNVLPFILDPDDASLPNAVPYHTGRVDFTTTTTVNKGDVDGAMATADVVLSDTVGWSPDFCHNYPETRGATCWWVADDVYCWHGSQSIQAERDALATALGMPANKVHFWGEGSGGGYGNRKSGNEEGIIAAIMSKKVGMPVNCQWNYLTFSTHGTGHSAPQKTTMKLGCKKDGTIVSLDATNTGSTNQMRLSYKTDNIRIQNVTPTTNKPRYSAFRSTGEHHNAFCVDQMMDAMADKLGMDIVDFRMKNAVTPDRLDQILAVPMGSCVQKEVLQLCADKFGWTQKKHAPGAKTLPDGRLHGVGTGCSVSEKGGAMESGRTTLVFVQPDGTAYCNLGIGESSNSTHSAIAGMVAEALGITYDQISVGMLGNTDASPYGGGQGGSRCTASHSTGAYLAGKDALNQLFVNAAATLKTTVDQLDARGGKIFIKSDPTKFVTHGQATGGNTITGRGVSTSPVLARPVLNWPVGTSGSIRTMLAEMVEIAVDAETGQIEVLSRTMVQDWGRACYRGGVEGQMQGGMVMEHGEAFYWDQVFDPVTGALLNGNFLQQRNPTAMDFDWSQLNAIIYESNDAITGYGVKGGAEPPCTLYSAFYNAFYNATGTRVKAGCMYPASVLKALGKI